MKIAFLSVFAFDANISLIKSLRRNHDVYFITEALHELYNYIDVTQLKKNITKGSDVKQLERFSEYINLDKTYVLKGVRNLDIVNKFRNSWVVDKLLKDIDPDIIIFDNISLTYLFSMLFKKKKSLLIVHDPFPHSGEDLLYQRLLKKLYFSQIKNKVLLNNSQRNEFLEVYNEKNDSVGESFLSVYDFLKAFDKEEVESSYEDGFNVLFFGRISPYKGIEYLLQAFHLINKRYNQEKIHLTIAGSGDFNFDILKYQASNITVINRFIGFSELANIIKESSIVICPYTDATQSGVVMSAFAYKKPVIATNVGGLPEMVENDITGKIVEPKNIEQLSEAIMFLYENPEELIKMSDNIKQIYFQGNKSWDKAADLLSIHFAKIINRNLNT